MLFLFLISKFVFAGNLFNDANKLYNEGNYEKSIKKYQKLLNRNVKGVYYYNMAVAYYRLNELGKSIINFRQALKLLPRDSDIKYNIKYISNKITDKYTNNKNIFELLFFWNNYFSFFELFLLLIIVFVFAVWIILKSNFYLKYSYIIFMIILCLSTFVKFWSINKKEGVIINNNVEVKSEYSSNGVVLFKVNEGLIVEIENKIDGWIKVKMFDGRKGWIAQDNMYLSRGLYE